MKLLPEKLNSILEKKTSGFYFCSSDDTFLINELADKIILSAKKNGFTEVSKLYADSSVSGGKLEEKLYELLYTPSIFSPKIAVTLQLSSWKLDDQTKKILSETNLQKSNDILLIVKGPKIERAMANTKWFQAMTLEAYWIEIPVMYPSKVPDWLQQRATQYAIKLTRDQANLIAQRTENNLPAAAQALEKLYFLNLPITTKIIEDIVEVSAEYDVFKLIDACLARDSERAYKIFFLLKNNATEPLLIIGALARELRNLRELTYAKTQNISLNSIAQKLGIWESRLPLLQNFIKHHDVAYFQHFLAQLADLDAIAKGASIGNIWNELFKFCMKITAKEKTR